MIDLDALEKLLAEAPCGELRAMRRGNSHDRSGNVVGQSTVVGLERPWNPVSHWEQSNEARTATVLRDADADLIVALRNAAPALLRDARALGKAWDSANRMRRKLGGVAPWDGGPSLFEMNEMALDQRIATARREALEEAAKVCEALAKEESEPGIGSHVAENAAHTAAERIRALAAVGK